MSAFDVVINDGFSADSVVTGIAAGDLSDNWRQQDENDAQLLRNIDEALTTGKSRSGKELTPFQLQALQKERARLLAAPRADPIYGNAQLFVDAAAEQGAKIARGAVGSLFDEFLPLTLAVIGLVAFGIFVRFYPGPGKA